MKEEDREKGLLHDGSPTVEAADLVMNKVIRIVVDPDPAKKQSFNFRSEGKSEIRWVALQIEEALVQLSNPSDPEWSVVLLSSDPPDMLFQGLFEELAIVGHPTPPDPPVTKPSNLPNPGISPPLQHFSVLATASSSYIHQIRKNRVRSSYPEVGREFA
ncbi:hypothetical protein Sjap_021865 [Stephania japonica]|uniref:Uncharacterized protein n=1 Tax=Stephania japonica TaxID=461633 RepID=A0AAP0EUZ3_9MAGN